MRTKTVVELTDKEVIDALVIAAKKAVQSAPGSVHIEVFADGKRIQSPTANVVFEWGAKIKAED